MERRSMSPGSGPLEELAGGFLAELAGLGYSPRTGEAQLCLMRALSRWLEAHDLTAGDLTGEVAEEFVCARRQVRSHLRSRRALVPLLRHLRGLGLAPPAPAMTPATPEEVLLGRFASYLATQRGLAAATGSSYLCQVRPFVAAYASRSGGWDSLSARQVTVFLADRAVAQRPRSVQVRANALRCLLRWMWQEHTISSPLAGAVGTVFAPYGTIPPKALSPDQLKDLLAALPRGGPARLRNEPMLLMMWRLGMRAGEVASLRLDDINWREGVLVIRRKRGRLDQMPLPADAGKLLVAYLQRGRPAGGAHREVFLALDAPHGSLTASAVTSVAARALARAGIEGPGAAHRLRHTAACGVLAAGGGLVEAGQLLGHSTPQVTAVYAKCDLQALSALARPWPAGAAR